MLATMVTFKRFKPVKPVHKSMHAAHKKTTEKEDTVY